MERKLIPKNPKNSKNNIKLSSRKIKVIKNKNISINSNFTNEFKFNNYKNSYSINDKIKINLENQKGINNNEMENQSAKRYKNKNYKNNFKKSKSVGL